MAEVRYKFGPYEDWIEKDGYGQFRLVGPLDRFIVDASSGVCTGTLVNTVGGSITLEADVALGNGVSLLTGAHDITKFGAERVHSRPPQGKDIIIRRGAWVANNCTIIGPADIGEHAVVTAGTVVRGVVPAYAVIAPQPWRIVKMLNESGKTPMEVNIEAIRDMAVFDRNWSGPPELKPRCYRSQLEKDTWYSVVVNDEYKCPEFKPDDVVLDIGAHIGSFSYLAHMQGSRKIYAYEPNDWHYVALVENCEGLNGITPVFSAVVRSDDARAVAYRYARDTWTIIRGPEHPSWAQVGASSYDIDNVPLDRIIDLVGEVRFLKIDCEGSEWPILYTAKNLNRVQEIVGEYHPKDPQEGPELQGLPGPCRIQDLLLYLWDEFGFRGEFKPDNENDPFTLGKFRAVRT